MLPFAHGAQSQSVDSLQWVVPVLVVALGVGLYGAGALAHRAPRDRAWSRWRTTSWLVGVVLIALALSPALAMVATGARDHVLQHLVLGMLGPLALVMGAPVSLLLGATPPSVGRRVSRVLRSPAFRGVSHPVVAAAPSVGGMYVLYLTPLYAASMQHEVVHHLVHVHFLAAGYVFSWSIAGPDPAPHRPGSATRLAVLVLAAAAHSYLAKLLYARAGELPPGAGHGAREMEVAAQWMYYGGDVAEVLLAAALFAGWYRRSGRRGHRASSRRRPLGRRAGRYLVGSAHGATGETG